MERCRDAESLDRLLAAARADGRTIGFVPTMGALHAGHRALVDAARAENDVVVVSIFVNPAQFQPGGDFDTYPRPLERDAALLEAAGADVLFHPDAATIYPPGFSTWIEVQGPPAEGLDGASRPGYFRGICTVVHLLFALVRPTRAYFGMKDAQQARVVARMIRDLHMGIELRTMPTVREPDGLAMSSRNASLGAEDRPRATALVRALRAAEAAFAAGERGPESIEAAARAVLEGEPALDVDYCRIVDGESMQPVERIERPALLALAAMLGGTRLIDNATLDPALPRG